MMPNDNRHLALHLSWVAVDEKSKSKTSRSDYSEETRCGLLFFFKGIALIFRSLTKVLHL